MPITVYGIKTCDTMKKARAWLEQRGVEYAFHDYKTAGIERERLERWEKKVGWETLLNRSGTTFRKLPDKDKNGLDARKATALILAAPSMINARRSSSPASPENAAPLRSHSSHPLVHRIAQLVDPRCADR